MTIWSQKWCLHIQSFPESVISSLFPQSCRQPLQCVWVFLVLSFRPDERLSKHRPPGLLIFTIHTSCTELLSRMGWDFVTSWKNEILFIYKNGCASVGDIICVSHALAMTLNPEDDVTDHIVSKRESLSLWWGCELCNWWNGEITLLTAMQSRSRRQTWGILSISLKCYFH